MWNDTPRSRDPLVRQFSSPAYTRSLFIALFWRLCLHFFFCVIPMPIWYDVARVSHYFFFYLRFSEVSLWNSEVYIFFFCFRLQCLTGSLYTLKHLLTFLIKIFCIVSWYAILGSDIFSWNLIFSYFQWKFNMISFFFFSNLLWKCLTGVYPIEYCRYLIALSFFIFSKTNKKIFFVSSNNFATFLCPFCFVLHCFGWKSWLNCMVCTLENFGKNIMGTLLHNCMNNKFIITLTLLTLLARHRNKQLVDIGIKHNS